MTTIALYNIKGGVGKTAGCVNLAYLASEEGKRVLLWDLDPQGSASFYFKIDPRLKGGAKKLLGGDAASFEANIQPTEYDNLSLLPADFSNRHLDVIIEETKQAKKKLKSQLASLQGSYDYLFIDCPPGIGPLSEAILPPPILWYCLPFPPRSASALMRWCTSSSSQTNWMRTASSLTSAWWTSGRTCTTKHWASITKTSSSSKTMSPT
jgi:hypothetical protein